MPAGTAPYTARIVVVRPTDPAKFSGTAVVEWLNVSGGFDIPVDWIMTHREIVRRGHAYVGVSAQKLLRLPLVRTPVRRAHHGHSFGDG